MALFPSSKLLWVLGFLSFDSVGIDRAGTSCPCRLRFLAFCSSSLFRRLLNRPLRSLGPAGFSWFPA